MKNHCKIAFASHDHKNERNSNGIVIDHNFRIEIEYFSDLFSRLFLLQYPLWLEMTFDNLNLI